MAEMVPPAVPTAGSKNTLSSCRGKKDLSLGSEKVSSFDSCKRVMCGFITTYSERMSKHLASSPRPRTFQEQIEKASLLIKIIQTPAARARVQLAYIHKSYG